MDQKKIPTDFLKNLNAVLGHNDDDTNVSSVQSFLDKEVCPLGGKRRETERRFLSGELTLDEYLDLIQNPFGG